MVTILNESMYSHTSPCCHWKIRAAAGPKLLKSYFQRLSFLLSALLSQPCGLQEPLMLARALENCKDEGCQG